jgi:hypothetical protein
VVLVVGELPGEPVGQRLESGRFEDVDVVHNID